jgi:hypothetical protein
LGSKANITIAPRIKGIPSEHDRLVGIFCERYREITVAAVTSFGGVIMRKGKKKTKRKTNRKTKKKPTRRPKRRLTTITVGLLHNGSSATFGGLVTQLQGELPRGVVLDANFAADRNSLPIDQIADALIAAARNAGRRHYVIVAAGGPETACLLRDKTQNLPDKPAIVFTTVTNPGPETHDNPGGLGLVHSVTGPGGTNLTGMWGKTSERDADRLEILFRLLQLPQDNIGVLVAGPRPKKTPQFADLLTRARRLGIHGQIRKYPHDPSDIVGIGQAFDFFRHHANQIKGVVVMADSLFNDLRRPLIAIANGQGPHGPPAIPTIYQWKEFVDEGGLVSFGPPITVAYRNAGQFATRILNREEPEDMQVSTPNLSTFEVWIKISTARSLPNPMPIPPRVRADGVDYDVRTIP